VARFYIDLPVWDYWNTIQHYSLYKAGDLRVLWVQHNEHRIVFPEIVFALDLLVFHGHIILPTVLSFCLYFGIWVLMVWAFFSDREVALVPRHSAIFLAAILFTWKGCAVALGIPFLLQWTMNQFFTVLALMFLAKLSESRRALWLVLLCVSAVVCNYTSGNGLMLWPLLAGFAVLLRLPWRYTVILGLVGALSVGLYFVGYQSLGPLNWRALIAHPIYFAKFMASYVSMPFAALQGDPAFGVRVGLTSLGALLALLLIAWRERLLGTTTGIVLFGYLACVLLSGIITALGRMNPNDPLLQSPKAIRYITMPLTYWGTLAIVSMWITARFFRESGTLLASLLAVGLALLLFRMSHKPRFDAWYDAVATVFADQQWAALAVESGVLDPVSDKILFPDPNFVPSVTPLMRAERLSLFSEAEPFWLGRDIKTVFPAAPRQPQAGAILASEPLETAVTVAGWAAAGSSLDEPLELVLVDESNRIVGLGARLPAGLPPRFSKLKIAAAQQWCGFVNPAYHSHTVSPFVLTGDHKALIPLAGGFTIVPR
jgi:hypothetical protein